MAANMVVNTARRRSQRLLARVNSVSNKRKVIQKMPAITKDRLTTQNLKELRKATRNSDAPFSVTSASYSSDQDEYISPSTYDRLKHDGVVPTSGRSADEENMIQRLEEKRASPEPTEAVYR